NKTGVGYTLVASSGTLTGAASAAFNVMPGTPTHLGFVQQPTNAVAGAAISPAVTVQLLDANNNTVTTDSTDAVTMAIGANPGSGGLKSATSASFNITSASTTLEDFEHGLGLYFATSYYTYATTATFAAHDGTYGLDMMSSSGWAFRNDAAAQVKQGETISVW